ncbi:MAG: trehalase family glycosidase [Acetobacter sp.]
MLVNANVPSSRAWNTWSDLPAEMVFLPLGVRVTPVLYSTRLRRATLLRGREHMRLGRHSMDGDVVEFVSAFGGTELAFSYTKPDPWAVVGSWRPAVKAEWGLRYWVSICLSSDDGSPVCWNGLEALVTVNGRTVALGSDIAPVQVTVHDTLDDVVADYEKNGYFFKESRGTQGNVLVLRFNLEMMPQGRFAAAAADSAALAVEHVRAALGQPVQPALPVQTGRFAGALDAVRDVMAWNTLYDRQNHRAYTCVSRFWNLGSFAVWWNDQTYAALMTSLFDRTVTRENIDVSMASATPQGNFACILTSNDSWVDRTQAPNGAFMMWLIYLRTSDRTVLERCYGDLVRNHMWWRTHRDVDGSGLVSCGTSDVGDGLYQGTRFGACNETGMDNSPTHDEATYDPATRSLSTLDLGLNCSLTLDAEMLSLMARELGDSAAAARFATLAEQGRQAISTVFWDAERCVFANRQRGGGFVRSIGPTSLYPLVCGAATQEQARHMVALLTDPARLGGTFMLPNVTRDDPAFADNVYWRGRIWPNVNYFVWQGLQRYGLAQEAEQLATSSMALFDLSWTGRRIAAENYNADTGLPDDQPDTDLFLSWGGMLPLIGVSHVMDFNPWQGWRLNWNGETGTLGPVNSPVGPVSLEMDATQARLLRNGRLLLAWSVPGVLSHLRIGDDGMSCRITAASGTVAGGTLVLGERTRAGLVLAHENNTDCAVAELAQGLELTLAGTGAQAQVMVCFVPADTAVPACC